MKPIFLIILTTLIVLISFQVYALVNPDAYALQTQPALKTPQANQDQSQSGPSPAKPVKLKKAIDKVTQRNLFRVQVNGKKNDPPPQPANRHLEKTSLKLTLWGTVTGSQKKDGWAVIEDIKEKHQDLYRVNDKIQDAVIKSILRNKVILTVNGKDQILEVNDDPSPARSRRRVASGKKPKLAKRNAANMPEPPEMPETAPRLNPRFKTRPYIKNGDPSGLMIYSIKKDSVAKRVGLRNGDIIQAVDEEEIQGPEDFEDFNADIDDASEVTISILRRGKPKELVYSAADNTYTIHDVEQ